MKAARGEESERWAKFEESTGERRAAAATTAAAAASEVVVLVALMTAAKAVELVTPFTEPLIIISGVFPLGNLARTGDSGVAPSSAAARVAAPALAVGPETAADPPVGGWGRLGDARRGAACAAISGTS